MPKCVVERKNEAGGGASVRVEIAFDDEGSGPAVVFLHGYPFNRTMWREQVAALRPSHRVVAVDLRGHGESEVTDGIVTMEDMARDVKALMDRLDIKRAAVVGLSMGGYVALAFCRFFSTSVRALILADTRAQADTEEAKANRAAQIDKLLSVGMGAIADAMLPKLLSPATFSDQPDLVTRVRQMMVTTDPKGAAAALRGMAARRDFRSFVSRILAPTLVIVGNLDSITPVDDSKFMQREIGRSRLEILDGAGHVSNLEKPDEFNGLLLQFLQAIEV